MYVSKADRTGAPMQIKSQFSIAVHILTCIAFFQDQYRVTSEFLAGSIGANPVIIRTVISALRQSGFLQTRQGAADISIAKPLDQISLYDIYIALECISAEGLFHLHEQPNPNCPVGRNIHACLTPHLERAQSAMENVLKETTLQCIVDEARKQELQQTSKMELIDHR